MLCPWQGLCYNHRAVERAWKQEAASRHRSGKLLYLQEQRLLRTIRGRRRKEIARPMSTAVAVAADVARTTVSTSEDVSRYCPLCLRRLESKRCKLICPECSYYSPARTITEFCGPARLSAAPFASEEEPEEENEEETNVALKMTYREVDGVAVVALDGRIVLGEESNALREKVKSLIAEGKKKIVLNMDNITFIDSAGLGTLVAAHHSAKSQGASLRLCHLGSKFQEVLQITKLLTVFEVYDTEAAAVSSFSKGAGA
jgi:anti-sigma B factor antagonist